MINVLEMARRFQDQWIVLDRRANVVDHGNDFAALYSKYGGAGRTLYFASAA